MKVFFNYGTMNSSKTANLLMVHYDYVSRGKKPYLIKPTPKEIDTPFITTRAGLDSIAADIVVPCSTDVDLSSVYKVINNTLKESLDVVIIDEAQFLTPEFIKSIIGMCNQFNVDIMAYGLKTDYNNELFDGTKTWLALSDRINEVKTVCDFCNNKAIFNKLNIQNDIDNNIHVTKSDYSSVCRNHY